MKTSFRTGFDQPHAASRLRTLCALVAMAAGAAGAQTAAPQSATVTFASGNATIVSAHGERRAATNGLALASGDTVETGKGRVQLRMIDGALMSLQPETTLRLDEYHLATAGGTDEKGYMSLVKGGLRTVSGFIGKARPDNYRLQTPAGLIGIRGTEYTAMLRDGLTVGVIGGRVAVCNDSGCQDVARGQSAFTASMSARPVVSRLVSTIVPAATPAAAEITADAGTQVAAAPAPVVRTSGEAVRGYLQSLLVPTWVDAPATAPDADTPVAQAPQTAPGSFSPPPIATGPTPSPAPAPGNGSPSGQPSPTNPSTGFVEMPLPSGVGTLVLISQEKNGVLDADPVSGYRTFDGSALTQLNEKADGKGKKFLEKGVPVDAHADGIVAWGRWTSGKSNFKDDSKKGNGEVEALHYFGFSGTPSLPVLKSFSAFASTSPTITSAKGDLLATGVVNSANGTLKVTFPGSSGGFATYNLAVPVAGQTFSLIGSAVQTATFGFLGGATISSTGGGCAAGCNGALTGGNAVQGMVGGNSNSRAGLVYGFTSNLGQVSGAMVFKP